MIFETDVQRCLFWNIEYTETDCLFWRKLGFLFLVGFFFLSVKLTYVPLEKIYKYLESISVISFFPQCIYF